MWLKALRDLLHIGLDTSHTWIVPPSLEIPATMVTLGTAIRAKRRSHLAPTSVVPGGNDASRQNPEKGTQMKMATTLLAGTIVSLATGLGIATDSHAQSTAPSSMSDQAYYQALYKALREYGTGTARGGLPVGVATAVAIAQCQEGNPKPAIPVLEQQLHDRRIPVPSRS